MSRERERFGRDYHPCLDLDDPCHLKAIVYHPGEWSTVFTPLRNGAHYSEWHTPRWVVLRMEEKGRNERLSRPRPHPVMSHFRVVKPRLLAYSNSV